MQEEENAQAHTELKSKKQKKPEGSPSLLVSESLVDDNQPEWEQKTSEDDESKESSFLSESELPESHNESISNSLSESHNPSSGLLGESLQDIQSCSTLSDSPLELAESGEITGEPISNSLTELPKHKEVPVEGQSDSQQKQTLVLYDNHPKTLTDNSESLTESLGSSQSIKETQNYDALPDSLTGAALARRLDVSPSTLRHKKTARNFGKWTKGHDPDGIAWQYDGKKFIPQQQG